MDDGAGATDAADLPHLLLLLFAPGVELPCPVSAIEAPPDTKAEDGATSDATEGDEEAKLEPALLAPPVCCVLPAAAARLLRDEAEGATQPRQPS